MKLKLTVSKELTFDDVIQALKRGEYVRRSSWCAGYCLKCAEVHVHKIDNNMMDEIIIYDYGFSWNDIIAKDWYIMPQCKQVNVNVNFGIYS